MSIQLSFFRKIKLSDTNINKVNNHVNRGFELILTGGKRKQPKDFHIIFEKLVCFLKREVTIYFEFSLAIKKKSLVPRRKKKC